MNMHAPARTLVRLASETDFDGWRRAARALCASGVHPDFAVWTVDGWRPSAPSGAAQAPAFSVHREFLGLAEAVVLHRSDERFDLLYRLLWRLMREPRLLSLRHDRDAMRARAFAGSVEAAAENMKAHLRFRPVAAPAGPETYVAWFEPGHRVTQAVAPFFARRFEGKPFAILTPDACVWWDADALAVAPGLDPADAPDEARLEAFWRARRGTLFTGPLVRRLSLEDAAPRYWRNLREPRLIPELIARAEAKAQMVREAPHEPDRRTLRAAQRASRDAPFDGAAPTTIEEVWAGVSACRRCELWRCGNGVAGEGPRQAKLMFVGEQPGDQEEQAVKPFVGPAGKVLDKALAEAGVPRGETFVTNAVKHFKHELRGKRRLHKTPDAGEVQACRWWLDNERRIVRPRVIVALGATAALSVFGRATPVGKFRQQAIQLPDQAQGVVTYHPSYLLRVPDAEAKAKAYAMFVEDLKFAWKLAA